MYTPPMKEECTDEELINNVGDIQIPILIKAVESNIITPSQWNDGDYDIYDLYSKLGGTVTDL